MRTALSVAVVVCCAAFGHAQLKRAATASDQSIALPPVSTTAPPPVTPLLIPIPDRRPVTQVQAAQPSGTQMPGTVSSELLAQPRFVSTNQAQPPLEDYWCGGEQPSVLPDGGRGAGGQFWLRGEYLMWWTQGTRTPPLITSGVPGLSPLPGILGQPGTTTLFGGSDFDSRPRQGGRFTGGFWLDPCRMLGVEASYFFLANRTSRFDARSDSTVGSILIARPFFDVISGNQNAQLVAFPALANGSNILTATGLGLASGEIHASTYSRLQGAEINALWGLCSGCDYWVQMIAGFRYLNLEEGLSITETTRVNPALPAASPFFGGSTISIADHFDTRNNFYGGQVGLRGEVRRGRMFLEIQSKIAMGVTNQVVDIRGNTAITSADGTTTSIPVGFLASGSNSGRYEQNRFTVVPEVGVNAGVLVTPRLRAFVGYNFLYWSSVVRPGDQIDTNLSGTQIPTDIRYNPTAAPFRPAATIRDTGLWVQGISFGLELRY